MPFEPETPDDLIPAIEATKLLPSSRTGKRIAVQTVYRWIENGRLRGWRLGGCVFVSRAEARAMLRPIMPLNARYSNEPTARERRQREAWVARKLDEAGL